MDSEIFDWLPTNASPPSADTKAAIRAHLGEFVRGERVDDLDFMKRIEDRRVLPPSFAHGVWSISPRFKPQYRLFGLFAITDWFVCLSRKARDELDTDSAWHAQIDKCRQRWTELFPSRDAWVRDTLKEYVSFNAEKCDDRW